MNGIILINFIVQLLSYIFIALLVFVSYLKLRKRTKEEDISINNMLTTTFSAFITAAILILFAGWIWDWLGFASVLLGVIFGVILALISKIYLSDEGIVLVQGRRIGTIIWLISVIVGEFILMWFSDNSALQASFMFGFFIVASMNTVYLIRFFKLKFS